MPTGGSRGRYGFCRWCGDEILHHKGKHIGERNARRGWHDGREGEPECVQSFLLHTRSEVQYRFLVGRDGEKCWDCGKTPMRWRRGHEVSAWTTGWPKGVPWPRYTEVAYDVALEVEHTVPLWSVAHLPDDERAPYYGPANIRLRCPACHGPKTAREAAERAAWRKSETPA